MNIAKEWEIKVKKATKNLMQFICCLNAYTKGTEKI